MNLIGVEFKKIISKKYVWIIALLVALFYAYLILNLANNFNVIYTKNALQPVFDEIMDAAYNPQVQEYIINKGFNVTFEEIQPMISPKITQTIEQYQGKVYEGYDVAKELKEEAALRIESLVERNVTISQRIEELKNAPDTPLNRYLLQQYTHMPKMEPNLTRWDDWIDINNSMLPLLIAFVIILGISGVYTSEYTSKMHGILLTTKNGRSKLFWSKLLASCLFAALTVIIFQVFAALLYTHVYGIPFKNTPMDSLTSFYKRPNTMWALQFYLCQLVGSLLGAMVLTAVTLCISSFCRSNLASFFLSGIYFALGTLYSQNLEGQYISSKVTIFADVSTFSLMSLTDVLGNGKVFIVGNSAIPTIELTVIAQAVIFAVALSLTYLFYNRKEIDA
ncbi:ABC transporter permease [Coprothermobacter platensis]|uniref:ABC transporter permease n=1 Tax=Coprothermobacter platensis TaxID=108819 RepID=UPI00035E1817|nr:ABC transporter permease subunit [Coprothermobacter platensis]